jgi:hypothetical protein
MTVPLAARMPVIDGTVGAKEWGGAAALPPLMRVSDGVVEGFATRISLAWTPDVLFIAIQHARPRHAPLVSDPTSKDELSITLTGPNRKKVKLLAWAGSARLEPDDATVLPPFQQAGNSSTHGWTAELLLPLNRLGSREELLKSGAQLEAELREPSFGAEPKRLTQHLGFVMRQLAFRFLDAGEFEGGAHQGCMLELVNADDEAVNLSVKASVSPNEGASKQFQDEALVLPASSRRRIRLAFPAMHGRFASEYRLSVNGAPFARGQYQFDGIGPLTVDLIPGFLWRGGVIIRSHVANITNDVTYRCELTDANTKKTLSNLETDGKAGAGVEQFVDTSKLRVGSYVITVTALDRGQVLAARQVRFARPERPKWSTDREREK